VAEALAQGPSGVGQTHAPDHAHRPVFDAPARVMSPAGSTRP
jgi:hypothetical protein